MTNKPSILKVIGDHVELRQRGHKFIGRCPFHADRNPSFHVNEDKGVYHCFGCHAGGDVIEFLMRIDHLTFSAACSALGIKKENKRRPKVTAIRKRSAELAVAWVREQRAKLNFLVIDRMDQLDLADEIGDCELFEMFDREIVLVRAFHDSLRYPAGAAELLAARQSIEQITADVDIVYEPAIAFPPLTPNYLARINKIPLDFEGCFR
jgi:hypothetical protein